MKGAIIRFRGSHQFLSNFYLCPFEYDGRKWKSIERMASVVESHVETRLDEWMPVGERLATPREQRTHHCTHVRFYDASQQAPKNITEYVERMRAYWGGEALYIPYEPVDK